VKVIKIKIKMKEIINQMIQAQGSVSLSEYMNLSLHHPKHGYYATKNPFGMGGDFVTAPQLTTLFGEIIGLFFAAQWQRLSKNSPITFVELGSGNGFFIRDMLNATAKVDGFHENLRIILVEKSPKLAKEQKDLLKPFMERVEITWAEDFALAVDDINPNNPLFVFANEFFDAFPIRQFAKEDSRWHEIQVALDGDSYRLAKSKTDYTMQLSPFINILGYDTNNIPEYSVLEISFEAINIYSQLCDLIAKIGGLALIIDYGFIKNSFQPTLQALQNHTPVNIFHEPGKCDLTYLIDFGAYYNIANRFSSLQAYTPITQSNFLKSIGFQVKVEQALKNETNEAKKELIKLATARLTDADKMGDLFKVLLIESKEIA
jgi:SAM-dependent MidA family methyltransferase